MKNFKQKVINTWGKKGENWLIQLEAIIEALKNYWNLQNIQVVDNLSYNYVALAIQANKTPVALKITCDKKLFSDEYKALQHFAGQGAIKLLDIQPEYNALLLEQAVPGNLLKTFSLLMLKDKTNIYASIVNSLSNYSLIPADFTHVSQWCEAIDRIKDKRIDKCFVKKARQLKNFLLISAKNEYLCHGDLHLENIIQQNTKWLAIDPKGIIGEMAFEAAAFDLITQDELQDAKTVPQKIINQVTDLAAALDLNYDRLLAWIFLRIMISAQWFIEDKSDPREMLILAQHVYALLIKQNI